MFQKTEEIEKRDVSSTYLEAVADKLEKLEERIASVILFGSFARGDSSTNSDVDLLVVFKDKTPESIVSEVDNILTELENRYEYVENPDGFLERLVYSVKRKTGMFVSHFVCKEKDLENRNFHEIFSTEKFFSRILAPTNLVINNMSQDGIALYGKPLSENLKKPVKINSMVKSLFMNLLTAIGSTIIAPFYKKTVEMSNEAVKWSLLAAHQYVTNQSAGAEEAIKFLKNHQIYSSETLEEFKSLRNRVRENPLFIFKVPPLVIKLHLEALKQRTG